MVLERVFSGTPFGLKATRSWRRSLAKTLTWRLFATADTFAISLLITGNLRWAGSIVGIEFLTKMGWYFLHERAWAYARAGVVPARAGEAASALASAPPLPQQDERPRQRRGVDAMESSRLVVFTGNAEMAVGKEGRAWSGLSPIRSHKPNINHCDSMLPK
jgi:uncharacterized membrane protein